MRFRLIALLAAGAVLSIAGVAFAANQIKGGTYKGFASPMSAGNTIKFKVSANGKKVSGFKVSFGPISCQGADPRVASGGSGSIKHGKFKVSLVEYFPATMPSRHVGTLSVTGTFQKHGDETGSIKSKFTGANGYQASCDGTQLYSTTG